MCWICCWGTRRCRILIGGEQRRRLGVSDVVVSPQMKRWQALHTLAVVYRDAYNNQLNDRYLSKWDEYRELARGARERTYGFGIGLVAAPIPRAGTAVLGAGTGALAGALYYAQVSWVSASGQEGSASLRNELSDFRQQRVDGGGGECAGSSGGMERVCGDDGFYGDAAE